MAYKMGYFEKANKKALVKQGLNHILGGGGGIRTHERFNPLPVFKTGAFNHSATPPKEK